jgi:chromosome segregation ATPase
VIEFVLLFGLGFLAAALVALIVAPVIQRRVVTLTERRIRASVPLSAAEIRAEKDMARAAYAADNARLSTDLKQNREALTEATAHGMRLSNELVAIRAEKLAAEQSLEERDASIRELNAKIHKSDGEIANLTGNLAAAIRLAEVRKQEIAAKEDKINHLGAEIEELRIDIATLDTEAENFKAQISELRDERRSLRDSLKATEEANHDLAFRLKREEGRLAEAEAKLAKTITALTDRENALERRVAEMERFKEKNRVLSEELKAAKRERTAVEMNRVKAPAPAQGRKPSRKRKPRP